MDKSKYKVKEDVESQSSQNYRLASYWQTLGKLVALFCVPIICFTVLLALRIDKVINWNYWLVFIPIFVTLLGFLLVTTSQSLSHPVPISVRLAWIVWVIALSIFVVFLIFHIETAYSFNPSYKIIFIPLFAGLGVMFVVGFFLFIFGCLCGNDQVTQKRYIISATPIFCFSLVFIPLIALILFKETSSDISWGIIFIPLFVADAFCFCLGFFLLIFSFGGRNDAIFSITQLLIFLIVIPVSVLFKVMLTLYLDNILKISIIYIFIPLIVLEVLLFTCGIAFSERQKNSNRYVKVSS